MSKLQIVRLLVLMLVLLPLWDSAAAGNHADMERFLNVKQWRGVVHVSANGESHTSVLQQGKGDRVSNEWHSGKLLTASGEISPGDPFLASDEQAVASESDDIEEGDMLEGIDINSLPGQMRSMGMSEASIQEAMEGMGRANKLHVSTGKYKVWSLVPAVDEDMGSAIETMSNMGANEKDIGEIRKLLQTKVSVGQSSISGKISTRSYSQGQVFWDKPCVEWSKSTSHGSYTGESIALTMSVNLHKKTYSFKWDMPYDHKLKRTFQSHYENLCGLDKVKKDERGETNWDSLVFLEAESGDSIKEVKFEPLPVTGMVLSGSKTITKKIEGGSEQVTFSWRFVPSDFELPEVWIEYAEGGDEWIPEDDNTVKATLEWGDNIVPSQVRFTLYDISAEPGINLNSEDKNTEPDLEFAEENEANGFKITKSGESYVAVKEDLSGLSESIVLHAKDFGAYGKLKAEIKVDGHWFEATAKEFELPYLPVPYDKNENKIADKWEKEVGVYSSNLPPEWDEDPYPQGQKSNGDGFTLYEEYRGFQEIGHVFKKGDHEQVKDGHVRMDPMYKDVFIYDPNKLFIKYYKPYNPANLNWHLIEESLMKKEGTVETHSNFRWVNFNTSKKHFFRNQYAIYLENGHVSPDPEKPDAQGHTQEIELYEVQDCMPVDGNFKFPLKCWAKISLYPQGIHSFISRNYKNLGLETHTERVAREMLGNAVIHEVGHTLGITHHREPGVQKFTESGKKIGISTCAMRYDSAEEMKRPQVFNYYRATYCKAGDTYTLGETDEAGAFRQHQSHNCYGQINIKGN